MFPRPSPHLRRGFLLRGVLAVTGFALAGSAFVAPPAEATGSHRVAQTVLGWNEAAGRAALAACLAPFDNPLYESRMYAMAQLAVHDALNAIDRRSASYAPPFRAKRGSSPRAAVAAAARDTLVSAIADIQAPVPQSCRDAGTASVEEHYRAEVARLPHSRSTRRGLAAGHRAAAGIIALRVGDGADTPLVVTDFPQGTRPGVWRFTPGVPFAFAPGWGAVRPFALTSAGQFPAAPAYALTSDGYARDLNELKAYGGDGTTTPTLRSADQTEIALFWWESSPTMWNRVARELVRSHHLDGWQQARLFGQLNAALADGYVASFATKYHDLFWRPVTAITQADTDGNPATAADPTWTPLRTTPPIPDHDSAQAVEGGAAAGVLSTFFGTDRLSFAVCSGSLPDRPCASTDPTLRHFDRISAAATENAVSRIYIGFHFRRAAEVGNDRGHAVGSWIAQHLLAPVHRS